MSLSASVLASLLKTNLASATDAATANTIMGDTITSYLLSNTIFTFVWSAVQTTPPLASPPPDPITSTTGIFASLTIAITPSGATSASDAMTALKDQIVDGMSKATYRISKTGFSTSAALMSSSSTLDNLILTPSGSTSGDDAMLDLCTKIITWVKQLTPAAPCTGTRTAGTFVYTGKGVVSSIT